MHAAANVHFVPEAVLLQSSCWSIHAAYVCSVVAMAAANLSIPHIHSLYVMCAVFFVNGFAGGTIQSGTQPLSDSLRSRHKS